MNNMTSLKWFSQQQSKQPQNREVNIYLHKTSISFFPLVSMEINKSNNNNKKARTYWRWNPTQIQQRSSKFCFLSIVRKYWLANVGFSYSMLSLYTHEFCDWCAMDCSLFSSTNITVYLYMYVCVCLCKFKVKLFPYSDSANGHTGTHLSKQKSIDISHVEKKAEERERESERKREREKENVWCQNLSSININRIYDFWMDNRSGD